LARVKAKAERHSFEQVGDARNASPLRCVSLVRLEREIAKRLAAGEALEESMLTLAGLRRVEYVLVCPESRDLTIAGPAGDWLVSDERRLIATDTGLPVVRLDDLLTFLRRDARQAFGCSIDPRPQSLAAAQQYLGSHTIPPGRRGREKWLEEVRQSVGLQDLSYRGLSADSRVACVLGEADYHMKLIGMGLADGTAGMRSYLDTIEAKPGADAPAVGAVRWWFEMNYAAIETSEARDAFKLVGQGVKLLSENEAIAAHGARRPTGKTDEAAQAFAASFTTGFARLCEKYAVYAELRNLFDLALVAALIQTEGLAQRASWSPGLLQDEAHLPLPRYQAPTTVESAANLRVAQGRQVLAQVSGGVLAQPAVVVKRRVRPATEYGPLTNHTGHPPQGETGWWWDVAP
ncbi:MAG: DUF1598 domain-containing protein, partial [Planctomycetales bacterium]|nr:DUF1598 domain-containing protein [Planctomycetales bacterium]